MREDIHILNEEEIEQKLKDFTGWKYYDNKISKIMKGRRRSPKTEFKKGHPFYKGGGKG